MTGDTLKVITPVKAYEFKREALKRLPRDKISNQLKEKVRKDTIKGNVRYKSLIQDFFDLDKIPMEPRQKHLQQMDILRQLRDFKNFDEKRLEDFAEYLKTIEGQK